MIGAILTAAEEVLGWQFVTSRSLDSGAMPTGFGPLGDDDIRPHIDRMERVIERMHLANQRYAGFPDPSGIRTWIREGEHHRTRMPLQRDVE